ncbi:hypothetical protein [Paenibacillus jiagnxiensis]|uniref:hypothetical protein n=1 Tax=Paenibacillus jiagnxiensis TaxID=3228926 RepID=UPI0033BBC280
MKYVKANGIEEGEMYYFELDDKGWAHRQVSVIDGGCRVSIAPDFMLSEVPVEMYEGDEEIGPEQFEQIWQQAVGLYKHNWERAKAKYSSGMRVTGSIAMFYPQGIMIRLEETVFAVTGYEAVRSKVKAEYLYPGFRMDGIVRGYDEKNFWLELEDCTMTGEKQEHMQGNIEILNPEGKRHE